MASQKVVSTKHAVATEAPVAVVEETPVVEAPVEVVAESPVEVTETQDTEEGGEEVVAQVVKQPIAVPADFKGKKLPLVEAGKIYANMMTEDNLKVLKRLGETPMQNFIGNRMDEGQPTVALILEMAKDGAAEKLLLVHPDNAEFIEASLASIPALKAQFAASVLARAEAIMASDVYQNGMSEIAELRNRLHEAKKAQWALVVDGIKPFEAKLYLAESIDSVQPLAQGAVAGIGSGVKVAPRRGHDTSKSAKWSLTKYVREGVAAEDGSRYVLERRGDGLWHVTTELGRDVFSEGFASANQATKYLVAAERPGKNPEDISYNANDFWSAREQENAAAGTPAA